MDEQHKPIFRDVINTDIINFCKETSVNIVGSRFQCLCKFKTISDNAVLCSFLVAWQAAFLCHSIFKRKNK